MDGLCGWTYTSNYNFIITPIMKKVLSILKWFLVMLIALLAFLTAPITYPLVYPYHRFKWSKNKPWWYWFDDEDGLYGSLYWRTAKGITKNNFWVSYRWCALRNPMWNLHASLVPLKGKEKVVNQKGILTKNGKRVALYRVAVIQYEDADGNWQHNSGDIISLKHSIIGSVFRWFTIQNKLYWRYSFVKNVFWRLWIEIQLGVGKRYTFRFKVKFKNHA